MSRGFLIAGTAFVAASSLPTASAQKFSRCDEATYYSAIDDRYDAAKLTFLLRSTHDRLPYTSSGPDVWDALIDLDANPTDPTEVRLVYRDTFYPAEPHGASDTWNREHLWPKSHGISSSGPDFTDIHAIRPSDSTVNSNRSNRFFSRCGIAEGETRADCVRPAHSEAARDTERDGKTFLPPASARGDIARALFYMVLRYDGSEPYTLNLQLTDCPDPNNPADMGFLSQLLRWHESDPVDEAEHLRNERACSVWQGNRNPFVDYPELALHYFGMPRDDPAEGVGYCSSKQTEPPTSSPTPHPTPSPTPHPTATARGTCLGLSAGDVMVIGMASDNPDAVVMVAMVDLPEDATLFMTDNAWTGTQFTSNEGVIKVSIPVGGIPAGSVVSYESGSSKSDSLHLLGNAWTSESGSFALSSKSDAVLLYCLDNDEDVVHLGAATYSTAGWSTPNIYQSSFSSGQSALPSELKSYAVTLPHKDNYFYSGERTGSLHQLHDALIDPSNWVGSNSILDVLSDQEPFAVLPD